MNVGPATFKLTTGISELIDFTTYSIDVAAVNKYYTGVYTRPVWGTTKCKQLKIVKTFNFFPLYSNGILNFVCALYILVRDFPLLNNILTEIL